METVDTFIPPDIQDRIDTIQAASMSRFRCDTPPAPKFSPQESATSRVMLGLSSFDRHMTNEGWQLQDGLAHNGFELWGPGYGARDESHVPTILDQTNPGTVIVQDKREWDASRGSAFDKSAHFYGSERLAERDDIFRLTICKDAHQNPEYHSDASREIGCHAWVCYYHPQIVLSMCPWIRPQHLIRTYHSINRDELPPWMPASERRGCLLSGAQNKFYYPLRHICRSFYRQIPQCELMPHPGYNLKGWQTPKFLHDAGKYKVLIATTSIFGYALRKIIEGVALGCVVVTDLPESDKLPVIDDCLVRIPRDSTIYEIGDAVDASLSEYDEEKCRHYAESAANYYDYRRLYGNLAREIEALRQSY